MGNELEDEEAAELLDVVVSFLELRRGADAAGVEVGVKVDLSASSAMVLHRC